MIKTAAKRADAATLQVQRLAVSPGNTTEPVPARRDTERYEIALLAYSYWEARGMPDGSPEEDWFRAERELGGRLANANMPATSQKGAEDANQAMENRGDWTAERVPDRVGHVRSRRGTKNREPRAAGNG
jgi:hypothetical protein